MKKPEIKIVESQKNEVIFGRGVVKVVKELVDRVKSENRDLSEFEESLICGYFAFYDDVKHLRDYGYEFDREKVMEEWVEASVGLWLNEGIVPVL